MDEKRPLTTQGSDLTLKLMMLCLCHQNTFLRTPWRLPYWPQFARSIAVLLHSKWWKLYQRQMGLVRESQAWVKQSYVISPTFSEARLEHAIGHWEANLSHGGVLFFLLLLLFLRVKLGSLQAQTGSRFAATAGKCGRGGDQSTICWFITWLHLHVRYVDSGTLLFGHATQFHKHENLVVRWGACVAHWIASSKHPLWTQNSRLLYGAWTLWIWCLPLQWNLEIIWRKFLHTATGRLHFPEWWGWEWGSGDCGIWNADCCNYTHVISCLLRSGVFAEVFICWILFSFFVVIFPDFLGRWCCSGRCLPHSWNSFEWTALVSWSNCARGRFQCLCWRFATGWWCELGCKMGLWSAKCSREDIGQLGFGKWTSNFEPTFRYGRRWWKLDLSQVLW